MDPNFSKFLFEQLKLQPYFFTTPYVSLLYTQALPLDLLLHLWDHVLFFEDHIVDFALIILSAYILFRKKHLLKINSYEIILQELQKPISVSIMPILRIAHNIWDNLKI